MSFLTWLFGPREIACQHEWDITDTTYSLPSGKFKNLNNDQFRMITEGITNIYLRCKKCGNIKSEKVFGKFTPPEFEWKKK